MSIPRKPKESQFRAVVPPPARGMSRRAWMALGGLGATTAVWRAWRHWGVAIESVFIARHQRYDLELTRTIRDGLAAIGFDLRAVAGKRVLLKPNLVEPVRERPHMTTHPAVVIAAAEVFLQAGAKVHVGEAPGHVRDTDMVLAESGVGSALRESRIGFADLNYEAVRWFPNPSRCSKLRGIYLPQTVAEADLVVSLPKLKTHHWVGVTAAMKNLYGVLPGIKYGWPKNVLHHAGIPETVVDIHATLPRTMTIVDAIDCMEGDGPILGSRKHMGLLVTGISLPAVDATLARIMGLAAERIPYLRLVAKQGAAIGDPAISQRGEPWRSVASDFRILDIPHLRALQAEPGSPLVSAIDVGRWSM